MAVATLNTGATSLAAGQWSDATGVVDGAQLVIAGSTANIQTALSYTSASIEYLDVLGGSPFIGGTGGSFICDADGTAEAAATQVSRIKYVTDGGHMYYTAGAGNTLAHFVIVGGLGSFYATGGIYKNVQCSGRMFINGSTVSSTGVWNFLQGAAVSIDDSATAIAELQAVGAGMVVGRGMTLGEFANSNVTLSTTRASTTVKVRGGSFAIQKSGTITTMWALGGLLDLSQVQVPYTITNLYYAAGATVRTHPAVTITNKYPLGAVGTVL